MDLLFVTPSQASWMPIISISDGGYGVDLDLVGKVKKIKINNTIEVQMDYP